MPASEFGRQRGGLHHGADVAPGILQRGDIVDVEAIEAGIDLFAQLVLFERVPECPGGGGEAARHGHAEAGQCADHFAQRGVLAAYSGYVLHRQGFKRRDIVVFMLAHGQILCKN